MNEAHGGGIIGWWARNSVAANLTMIAILVCGLLGYVAIERVVFPSVGWNGVTISVAWPGAAPQEIEEQIVVRVEEAIADLEGIEKINATAREGSGSVNVEAKRSVEMTQFIDEVKLRVDSINNLPPSSYRPVVQRWQSQSIFLGMALSGDIDRLALKRLADEIRDDIAVKVPGASRAIVWATLPEEVAIEVSEEALRSYGLTFDQVAQAVRAASINASSGSVRTEVGDITFAVRQLADAQAAFEDIVVRQTPDGAVVRVGDVAKVVDGFVDANLYTTYNGRPNALIAIPTLEKNMNVVETQRALVKYIEERNKTLPPGVKLEKWWDDSEVYFDRLSSIATNAIIGMVLVFVCLVLFLRPTVALWVTVGIAISFAGAFAILPLMGVSLNMLSLFAFLIVIGIVVDDAIVVGESIHNQYERGEKGAVAAILGTQLVAKPVIFAVITTIMAFAPWMLLTGPQVQFTRQISFVVIAALSFSLIESLIILPNHLSHMKPQPTTGFWGGVLKFQRGFADSLVAFARTVYKPAAETAIKWRYLTLAIFVAFFVLTLGLWTQASLVKFKFMPEVESDFLHVEITMPDGTPFSRVLEIKDQLEAAQKSFMEKANAKYAGLIKGDSLSMVESISAIAQDGRLESWIGLADPENRPKGVSAKVIAEELRAELGPVPDAEEVRIDATFNDEQAGIRFALQSKNLDDLRKAADDLKNQLATYDGVFDVRDNLQSSGDEARLTLKPGAQALGLTLADVTRQMRQAFYGEEVQRLPREGEDVRVMVRYPKQARESLDSLKSFRIRTNDGREVPLSSVADVEFAPGLKRINRRERQRTIAVNAEINGDARQQIMEDLDKTFFPAWQARHPGVERESVGSDESQRRFMGEIQTLQLIMFLAMYFLLAVAFRSVFQPLLVMSAIPFALAGAIVGHWIHGVPMALFSFFGIGAAAGVVINDNLVILDYVNRARHHGIGAQQALIDAGVVRFRPILLTSLTTFAGVLPMVLDRSTQAQFLHPMVISLAYAVLFAFFLTLFLVPALYSIGVDIKRYVVWAWKGGKLQLIGANYDADVIVDIDALDQKEMEEAEARREASRRGAKPQPAE